MRARCGGRSPRAAASSDVNESNVGVEVDVSPATRATTGNTRAPTLTSIPALTVLAWLIVSRRRWSHTR